MAKKTVLVMGHYTFLSALSRMLQVTVKITSAVVMSVVSVKLRSCSRAQTTSASDEFIWHPYTSK